MAYHRYYGVDTRMVRIFNTYGPRLQPTDGRVISNFMMQALQGEDLTVFGDGLADAQLLLCFGLDRRDCAAVEVGRAPSGEHWNPDEWTILECAQEVLAVTDRRAEIRHEPLPQDDPARTQAGHYQGEGAAGVVAEGAAARRLRLSLEYFQKRARAMARTIS